MPNNISISPLKAIPVILCGGAGTRLWPLSRSGFPKQFLCLNGNLSLLQQTAQRLMAIQDPSINLSEPIVVANEEHRFVVQEQMREAEISPSSLLLEPLGRNTAPALTFAALCAVESDDDPLLIVAASDQIVQDTHAHTSSLCTAIHMAASGSLVVLGIKPTRPETGYGYIQIGERDEPGIYKVARFVEKPDRSTAQRYLDEGDYYWNAGMFVLKASLWLDLISQFRPDIAETTLKSWELRKTDNDFIRPDPVTYASIPDDSIDYAVMERCAGRSQKVCVVPLDAGWSDLGLWDAVWDVLPKDAQGNVIQGEAIAHETSDCLIHASHRLVATVGVEGLVVVETADAVLVLARSRSQEVKHVVQSLGKMKRSEQITHRKVHRPWGWYDSVDEGERFKVKRIRVKPGASLSLQKHYHRAEHWIVVKGTAEITNGESQVVLTENQSTYIPLGVVHRLSNPGAIPLEIIEVQSGCYLGEDDIIRIEDRYGRNQ